MIADQAGDFTDPRFKIFHELMRHKVREILFISSPYDAWVMEKDRTLSEDIISEYQGLNLSHPPRLNWVASVSGAASILTERTIDLIIIMSQASEFPFDETKRLIKDQHPDIPIVRLYHRAPGYHVSLQDTSLPFSPDRTLMWSGDTKLLLALIKNIEDQVNGAQDTSLAAIRVIIFVEDSPEYLSSLLPVFYQELVKQTQAVMEAGLNHEHRLLTMRARPKILIAGDFESALDLFKTFEPYVLAVISDVRYPRKGILDGESGIRLLSHIHQKRFDIPLLLVSSESENREKAITIPAEFIDKNDSNLHEKVHDFFFNKLGFGPFRISDPETNQLYLANNLYKLEQCLCIMSDQTFYNHWINNDFSRWLFSRAETLLATELRGVTKEDFDNNLSEMRTFLYRKFYDRRMQRQRGILVEFDENEFDVETEFYKIGTGSLGGKARGLAFFSSWLHDYPLLQNRFDQINIYIPQTLILTTACFEEFISANNLRSLYLKNLSNETIGEHFIQARFPENIREQLLIYLKEVNYPLAVRSSSLLEDAKYRAYAGLYSTYMLTNNDIILENRLEQLINAIKMVYASTYYHQPKAFSRRVGNRIEEERMGVVIQQIVGELYGDYFYPTISGVAQSYNYYPFSQINPEDGVATIALGFGKSVTDGEKSLRFCPAHPGVLPQFSTVENTLNNSQRYFYALKMNGPPVQFDSNDSQALSKRYITDGLREFPVQQLSGSYDPQEHRIRDSFSPKGSPVITFSSLLKYNVIPLAEILKELLASGQKGMGGPVEIEFSIVLPESKKLKPQVAVLQIRPMGAREDDISIEVDMKDILSMFCCSQNALGNTITNDISDIIYVKPDSFEPSETIKIAQEIAHINGQLVENRRKYVLIGPGRWGSADRWLGIPVSWGDISGVGAIVETFHQRINAEPSQGSHFFHNITSLGINYLTILESKKDFLDWNWIKSLPIKAETDHVVHVHRDQPFILKVDGKSSCGALYKG